MNKTFIELYNESKSKPTPVQEFLQVVSIKSPEKVLEQNER